MNDQHPVIHYNRARLVRALGVLVAGFVMVVTADPPAQDPTTTEVITTRPTAARDLARAGRNGLYAGDDNVRVYRF